VDFLEGKSLYRADPRSGSTSPTGSGSVNATREVIISAGTFNTPQVLKLSGIGPKQELQHFKIPVLVNLPGVATNLQDRYETTVVGQDNHRLCHHVQVYFYANDARSHALLNGENGIDAITKGLMERMELQSVLLRSLGGRW